MASSNASSDIETSSSEYPSLIVTPQTLSQGLPPNVNIYFEIAVILTLIQLAQTTMLIRSLTLLLASAPLVFGDVKFTIPAAGASIAGGGTISVGWTDSGTAPSITDLSSYQLFLCAGGNDPTNFVGSQHLY